MLEKFCACILENMWVLGFFFNYDLILYLSSIRNIKLQVNWEERINFWGKNKYCHIMGLLPQILDKNVFFSLWSAR